MKTTKKEFTLEELIEVRTIILNTMDKAKSDEENSKFLHTSFKHKNRIYKLCSQLRKVNHEIAKLCMKKRESSHVW